MIRDHEIEKMSIKEIREKVLAIDVVDIDVEYDQHGNISFVLLSNNKTEDVCGQKCHYKLDLSATLKLFEAIRNYNARSI